MKSDLDPSKGGWETLLQAIRAESSWQIHDCDDHFGCKSISSTCDLSSYGREVQHLKRSAAAGRARLARLPQKLTLEDHENLAVELARSAHASVEAAASKKLLVLMWCNRAAERLEHPEHRKHHPADHQRWANRGCNELFCQSGDFLGTLRSSVDNGTCVQSEFSKEVQRIKKNSIKRDEAHDGKGEATTLITVLGNARGNSQVVGSFLNNLFASTPEADLALLFGGASIHSTAASTVPRLFRVAKFVWHEREAGKPFDYMLNKIQHQAHGSMSPPFDLTWKDIARKNLGKRQHVFGGTSVDPEGNGVVVPYLKWRLGQILVSTGLLNSYERFVVTRSDYQYLCSLDLSLLLSAPSGPGALIWLPEGEDWAGLNDRFAVLPRSHAFSALTFIEKVIAHPSLYASFRGNPELLWRQRLEELGLLHLVHRFPPTMFTTRSMNDSFNWVPGIQLRGIEGLVKYKSEYEIAKRTCDGHAQMAISTIGHDRLAAPLVYFST